jgi:hypothetical protein
MGRGQLVFKGEEKSKKKKSKTKHSKKDPPEQEVAVATAEGNSRLPQDHLAAHAGSTSEAASQPETTPQILTPPGEITTSGTVVTGYDTRFTRDLSVGDALIVTIAGKQEMRVVTMRLSDISLNLSSAFSENVAVPTNFQLIRKPRNVVQDARNEQLDLQTARNDEVQLAFGTYGTTEELVYREKTEHGSYRIKRVKVQDGKGLTRGDLLSMREKKKSDKYC